MKSPRFNNVRAYVHERCAGNGCSHCGYEGNVPFCEACGDSPDLEEISKDDLLAWLAYADAHLGLCRDCVAIEEEMARADTEPPPSFDESEAAQ